MKPASPGVSNFSFFLSRFTFLMPHKSNHLHLKPDCRCVTLKLHLAGGSPSFSTLNVSQVFITDRSSHISDMQPPSSDHMDFLSLNKSLRRSCSHSIKGPNQSSLCSKLSPIKPGDAGESMLLAGFL